MSLRRAFLVRCFRQGSAVFSRRYGRFCQLMVRPFSKTGRRFVHKRYYRSKFKTKAVLRRRWDSNTVVLLCENRHFILTAAVPSRHRGKVTYDRLLVWSFYYLRKRMLSLQLSLRSSPRMVRPWILPPLERLKSKTDFWDKSLL